MAESLSYEALKEMKFADYKKAFKEKSQWKKAKALVVLMDYKLGSRKTPIVIPLRRTNQLKPLLKQIKLDKHPNQKMAAGTMSLGRGEKGPELTFKMTHGGYALEGIEKKVAPLVKQFLKCGFVVEKGETAPTEEEETTLENQEETPTPRAGTPEQAPTKENNQEEGVQEGESQDQQESSPAISSSAVANTLKAIKALAVKIRKEVVPTIKQNTFGTAQEALIEELEGLLEEFKSNLAEATDEQLKKLEKHQQFVDNKVRPLLDKIKTAISTTTTTEEAPSEQAPQEQATDSPSTIDIKQVLKAIKPLAMRVHKEVAASIEQQTFGEDQAALLEELEGLLQQFDEFYQQATPKQQQQLARHQNNIDQKIRPLLEKLQAAAEEMVPSTGEQVESEQAPQETTDTQLEESSQEETKIKEEETPKMEFNSPEEVDDFLEQAGSKIKEILAKVGINV